MGDPLLDAHRVAERRYLLSGPQPISLRDQILRGAAIVHRLKEIGEIAPNAPLVILGCGAGGATAAIEAASFPKTEVFLVERASTGFGVQRACFTRTIDPTQYDWPLDHCYHGRLPWGVRHKHLPLYFPAQRGSVLATWWAHDLVAAQSGLKRQAALKGHPPPLNCLFGATITSISSIVSAAPKVAPKVIALNIDIKEPSGKITSIRAGALIEAIGFGTENCRVEIPWTPTPRSTLCYEGQPFWSDDQFTHLEPV
ncbi:MAG: hypothetical protein WAS21_27330 [Geminicoccaceae bacterium]